MKTLHLSIIIAISGIVIAAVMLHPAFGFEPKHADYFSNPEFQIYKIQEKYYEFSIPYKISNAKIDRITIDCASLALLVYLNGANAEGEFTINISRKLIDTKIGTQDENFIVLINGLEEDYQEIADSDSRTLEIPLSPSSKIIEIIATNFGMFPEPIPCGIGDTNDSPYYNLLSPLKQFKSGIAADDVVCKEGLKLIFKSKNDSPACVKPETKQKLIERGWAKFDSKPIADSSPDQTKQTYLSMTVEEWKDMPKQKVMELYNKNEMSFDDLGKFLIKDEMKKELKRQGIENKHEDFAVFQGIVLTSLPPHISYHAVVNSTDGKSYLLAGSIFSNEIESIKIDQLAFHSDVLGPQKVDSERTLPFDELLAMEPKVTIVPPEGNNARVVPHALILNLEKNNTANFYNNLDVPIQIDGLDYTSIVPEVKKVWKSNIIQPGKSGKVQFNLTGYYEYVARTGEDNLGVAGMGTVVAYSNETKNLPFAEKLRIAGEFIQSSDIPWTSIDVGNDKGVTLGFSAATFHMIPDAERYYKARAQQWIPFDVPIIIEVPKNATTS